MAAKTDKNKHHTTLIIGGVIVVGFLLYFLVLPELFAGRYDRADAHATSTSKSIFTKKEEAPKFDKEDYDRRMIALANYASTTSTTTPRAWPTKTPYPKEGAILPFKRVIAYYGNFYSTKMGALGEYEPPVMLDMLRAEAKRWADADPTTPTIPAIHYIVTTAQGSPQPDGKYRLRMPDAHIEKAIDLAKQVDGIIFLDIQVGLSDLQSEIPVIEEHLKNPIVHLGIDPEFAMHNGTPPGRVIGSMSSADINYAINYLDRIVTENNLPPKILVVHRFTEGMVTGYQNIKPTENVQVVIQMDGWGFGAKKVNTYKRVVQSEPVQFTGFKIFYKNDLKPPSERLMTPQEVLSLQPRPIYIQYQ